MSSLIMKTKGSNDSESYKTGRGLQGKPSRFQLAHIKIYLWVWISSLRAVSLKALAVPNVRGVR